MIVGKNSAIKGFTWLLITILKLIVGITTIAQIQNYTFIGIIGIISVIFFGWEQFKEYKKLEKESNEVSGTINK